MNENNHIKVPYLVLFLFLTILFSFGVLLTLGDRTANVDNAEVLGSDEVIADELPENLTNVEDFDEFESEVILEGRGKTVELGDTVKVHYSGKLSNGFQFDTSKSREPLKVKVGAGQVIEGWERGLVGMQEGEVRKLRIPSDLAYGKEGKSPVIPGNAGLIFEIELVEVI
jgi:FKBP-type peptidyl-prolyl cis-trans isomerase